MHGNERGDEEGVDMRKSGEKKEVEEPEAIAHLHTSLGKKTYVVQIYHIRKEGGGGVPKWRNPIFRPHVADFHPATPLILVDTGEGVDGAESTLYSKGTRPRVWVLQRVENYRPPYPYSVPAGITRT